jgi:hypothetical protein
LSVDPTPSGITCRYWSVVLDAHMPEKTLNVLDQPEMLS